MSHKATVALGLLVVAGLGALGTIVAGPYMTLKRLGTALAARDSATIIECVDFERLRANTKQQLRLSSGAPDSPFAAVASSIVSSASDALVDTLVTPQGLDKLLAGERLFSSLGEPEGDLPSRVPNALANASTSFRSLSEFSAQIEPRSGMKVELVLGRERLTWKVVAVSLPR